MENPSYILNEEYKATETNLATQEPKKKSSCSSCGTGACNKVNVFDWLADIPVSDIAKQDEFIEVSFSDGLRKEYFINPTKIKFQNGDLVVVQGSVGQDMGIVSLGNLLAQYQMKKKKISLTDPEIKKVFRKPTPEDLLKWEEKKEKEKHILITSRIIVKQLNLNMKLSFVELQGDFKKGTFYFIADDRVDFRELIKKLVDEFRIKVDMKQIGIRQESKIVGGIGSCGRELCCSSWLHDFKSINTSAVRYQNLSINQVKLSGQCGRLKCCLNYELDAYVEAIAHFPKNAETIKTSLGIGRMVKKDIFKKNITYYFSEGSTHKVFHIDEVSNILQNNQKGFSPQAKAETPSVNQKQTPIFGNVESIKLKDLDNKNKTKHHQHKPKKSFTDKKTN